jgi:hypothetical protein
MLKISDQAFMSIYLSNRDVISEPYCLEDLALLWDRNLFCTETEDFVYIVHPKTYSDYCKFVKRLEKECPLLAELR